MDQTQVTQHYESGVKETADRPSLVVLGAVVSLVALVAESATAFALQNIEEAHRSYPEEW